jgi:pantoate--beta-alanine ligase
MLENDAEILEKKGANVLFAPVTSEIYPETSSQIGFTIHDLDRKLCGASRPGHFNGVVQVVSLLFHIIHPDNAYFGEKDFQQLMIIKQLVKEQHFGVNIHGCPIVREPDGLAMSSRNLYLSHEERKQAVLLSQILFYLKENYRDFNNLEAVKSFVSEQLTQKSVMRLDYFEILSENGLNEVSGWDSAERPHAFIAAFCGNTRLIDNMPLFS